MSTQTQTQTQVKVATKKVKAMTPKRVTVQLSERVIREGERISTEKLLSSVNAPTRKNLDELQKKFNVSWLNTAYDNTLPKDAKSGPSHSFVIEGRTSDGKKVFYDRFQRVIFVNKNRFPLKEVLSMTKQKFAKAVA